MHGIKQFVIDILVMPQDAPSKIRRLKFLKAGGGAILDTNLNGTLRACQSFYEPLEIGKEKSSTSRRSLRSIAFHEVAAYGASNCSSGTHKKVSAGQKTEFASTRLFREFSD